MDPIFLEIKNIKKNIKVKKMIKGKATRKTSKGKLIMRSPFKLNISTIVKSKASKVSGPIAGRNV